MLSGLALSNWDNPTVAMLRAEQEFDRRITINHYSIIRVKHESVNVYLPYRVT